MPSIGFIGGGNMAGSLIGGLINAGFSADDIFVAEPDKKRRQFLTTSYDINTCKNNNEVRYCDIIVFAVKPQLLKRVCQQFKIDGIDDTLFISIAAGVKSTDISRWLHATPNNEQPNNEESNDDNNLDTATIAIVRCMPNTPALLQYGATGLYANNYVSDKQKLLAEQIMQAVGIVVWVNEERQLNAVTAVSGSGPAYFFLMMEAMQSAGEKLGLSSDTTKKLVLQTALGAAHMANESDFSAAELRQMVTSKGGTTEQAILSFQTADFDKIILDALQAANDRSISLADELGKR